MKIIFLGTSGSVARKERDNTSLLIEEKQNYFLIDVPGSLVQKFKKLNIDYFRVNDIFITHIHPDHIYGLPAFIHARMFDCQSTINIYGHSYSLKFIRQLLSFFKLRREKFPKIRFHNLKPNCIFMLFGNLTLYPFKTRHCQESLGLKIKYKNKTIVYTSDTSYFPEIAEIAINADYLIHDCFAPSRFFNIYPKLQKMHTSPEMIAKVYKDSKTKVLIPIHFSGELNFQVSEISQEFEKLGIKNFIIPQDLQAIKIPHK